ncbi:MAG TPA: threonine dehydratase [Pseudolabrys sp.]|nr:threonine dehydratase [Pseudolabrys sp.]
MFTLDDLDAAATIVRTLVPPTPAYAWPLLARHAGLEVVLKHENHTPTGSFKARGGLVYGESLRRGGALPKGLVTATRGNHGQSVAIAARRLGIPCVIVVPEGNSAEKNAAMEAFGGELVTAGKDFDESRVAAEQIRHNRGYHFVPSFHRELVKGVATYARELFTAHSDLDVVYVPIGMGSGICGLITVRDLMGLKTEIVGVVAANAPAFALSLAAGKPVPTATARTFADGMACREPQDAPFEIVRKGAARIVSVTEDEIAEAVRLIFTATHNTAEGAGAAAFAALMQEKARLKGKRAGVILSGGNIDRPVLAAILDGRTPAV